MKIQIFWSRHPSTIAVGYWHWVRYTLVIAFLIRGRMHSVVQTRTIRDGLHRLGDRAAVQGRSSTARTEARTSVEPAGDGNTGQKASVKKCHTFCIVDASCLLCLHCMTRSSRRRTGAAVCCLQWSALYDFDSMEGRQALRSAIRCRLLTSDIEEKGERCKNNRCASFASFGGAGHSLSANGRAAGRTTTHAIGQRMWLSHVGQEKCGAKACRRPTAHRP
ncbi:hypothetical protein DTO045G8_2096 [Paecilomyces variotii]|nr:hypothetical protein DTO045G8_2096 [Paecilomyces variotii]